jgi:hypothetical protein
MKDTDREMTGRVRVPVFGRMFNIALRRCHTKQITFPIQQADRMILLIKTICPVSRIFDTMGNTSQSNRQPLVVI